MRMLESDSYRRCGSANVKDRLRGQTLRAGHLEQIGELLAGIEHPGFHRALRKTDDAARFLDRFLMVVDEVDDLAVRRRQFCDTGAQDIAGVAAVETGFGRLGIV